MSEDMYEMIIIGQTQRDVDDEHWYQWHVADEQGHPLCDENDLLIGKASCPKQFYLAVTYHSSTACLKCAWKIRD
jgi:hypothetical protein